MSLDLCKGIAVVIDDKALPQADEVSDEIVKIIQKIKADNIPLCIYTDLADAQRAINNFNSVSFLILDWDMQGQLDNEDADDIIKPSQANRVIKFINDFRKVCFCPIFIFSNAGVVDIQSYLKAHNLFFDDKRKNFIHVQAKKDLTRGKKLFSVINKWISDNPTNYTLKNWEDSFLQAKTDTFWHLFSKSPVWPKVMWESFTEDSVDPHSNLNDIIYRLIKSRTSLIKLDSKKINRRKHPVNHDEIKDVIQGMMFLEKKNIPESEIRPGDIFKKQGNYFINIRPECDTVIERVGYDGKIYLLQGSKISAAQFKKNHYNTKYGIIPSHTNFLLYGLDGKDFIRFNLKEMLVSDLADMKEHRICRLLPPYINDVQQQYSSYVGRFGLPRIPNRVLKGIK
jgi:hypothetical protein